VGTSGPDGAGRSRGTKALGNGFFFTQDRGGDRRFWLAWPGRVPHRDDAPDTITLMTDADRPLTTLTIVVVRGRDRPPAVSRCSSLTGVGSRS
jgi:hypothetical protein